MCIFIVKGGWEGKTGREKAVKSVYMFYFSASAASRISSWLSIQNISIHTYIRRGVKLPPAVFCGVITRIYTHVYNYTVWEHAASIITTCGGISSFLLYVYTFGIFFFYGPYLVFPNFTIDSYSFIRAYNILLYQKICKQKLRVV